MPRPAATAGKDKRRLDAVLVERGLVESRTRAQAIIMAGQVLSETRRLDKPGMLVSPDIPITLRTQDHPWASRGGLKLAHALDHFGLDPSRCVCLDVGASTGGFTDVLLNHGAAKVYALDVGQGQLAWKLREDPRVVVLEKINIRHASRDQVPEDIDFIVCDVSFISLTKALPTALSFAAREAQLVALIKPQFEVGKGQVGKGGVVRDPKKHEEVCQKIKDWIEQQPG